MTVVKVGEVYKAARITGPQHNFLGLTLSETAVLAVTVECLGIDNGSAESETLDAQKVLEVVQRGVTEANAKFGTRFRVARMQYVPTDTPELPAYALLAQHIVEQAWKDTSLAMTGESAQSR